MDDQYKIAIVEDDFIFRSLIKDIIRSDDFFHCVGAFTTVQEALGFLRKSDPLDLILLDIGLPDMNGIEAIGEIKAIQPQVKIIMLTVFDDDDKIFRALRSGASGYLLKADAEEKILQSMEDVLEGGGVFSSAIAAKVLNYFSGEKSNKYNLTAREKQVLKYLKQGNLKKMIADKLFIAYSTVDTHIKNIYQKLHVNSGIQAVVKAVEENLI